MLLAIDTATVGFSLALHDGRALLAEQTWSQTEDDLTTELAATTLDMLERCGVRLNRLTALAVSIGPGKAAGLRVGIAFAKGLAAGRGLPLVGISTLDTLATAQPHGQGALIVTLPLGRGRVVVGRYQWRKGRWGARGEPSLMDWDSLFESIDGAASLTGDIDADGEAALAAAQERGQSVTLVAAAYRTRRAGYLAEEAWSLLNSEKSTFPAAELQPITLKAADPTPES